MSMALLLDTPGQLDELVRGVGVTDAPVCKQKSHMMVVSFTSEPVEQRM